MGNPSILRIERLNYIISAVAVLIALLTQTKSVVLGLSAGAALTCANFFVLRKLVVKWTAEAAQGKRGNSAALMLPKMIALMGLVAVAVLMLPINVIAFAAGYSIFIASIVIESIYSTIKPPIEDSHG